MNSVGEFQSARDYLNDSARFGGLLEGYRPREAQLRMADAVAEAEQDVDGLVPVRDIGDPIPVRENDAT